jgi:hypothetical protein
MAKRTFGDVLKSLFGAKLDEEIDIDYSVLSPDNKEDQVNKDESTDEEKSEVKDKVSDNESKTEDTSEENTDNNEKSEKAEEENMADIKLFEDGWYDETSGEINYDKIKNPEALEAVKVLANKYKAEKEERLISDSLNEEIRKYSLNVSEDTLKKVLDTSGVKIDEQGKVVGIQEALESLKKSEPGFFKDKEKESSPLNEGFNPVEKQSTLTDDEIVALAYGQE